MIVYPAIDLRDGKAVQLIGGDPATQRIALPDPVAVARDWINKGFQALHIVDLDAAFGTGNNRDIIREIIRAVQVPVQVGGGVRDEATLAALIDAGATRVIVGTRAIEDASWRGLVANRYPQRLVVAADVRSDLIVTHGWTEQTDVPAESLLRELAHEPIAAVLITDVGREGQMIGVDVAKFERFVAASTYPVIAAGGIRDTADLHALADVGVAGAVLGMALYTGAIDASVAAGRA